MKRSITLGLAVFALAGSSFLASCTSKITKEQLATIRDLRQQEQSLNSQISSRNADLERLKREVAARQKEVDDCNTRKQFVQAKLKQWEAGTVWPSGLFPNN
jgi:peptidoglycan hydrolase CwlO-like protein